VGVAVAIVSWQQAFECVEKVVVGPGAGFDDRDTGGGMRDEDIAQAVLVRAAKRTHHIGEVHDSAPGGVDIEQVGVHKSSVRGHCHNESGGGRLLMTGGATGALPRQEGVDRVRTLYQYSGATFIY
jgi:hypothetical protein